MILKEITQEQYTQFRNAYKEKNFWQSVEMAQLRHDSKPSWDQTFIGLEDDGKLVASCVLVSLPVFGKWKLYMSLRGFLIDYDDLDLLRSFLKALKHYLSQNNCLYMKVDPYVEYQPHDQEGNAIEGEKKDQLIQVFEEEGFHHEGFRNGNDLDFEPRWMQILDLKGKTEQEVFKAMHTNTRQSIRNAQRMGVKVKELKREELNILKNLVDLAGEVRHFEAPALEKYEAYYDHFKEDFKACLAYIDLDEYEANVKKDREKQVRALEKAEKDLEKTPDSQKKINRKKEAQYAIDGCDKKLAEISHYKKEYGSVLDLAAASFMITPYEVLYLFSGSNKDLNRFAGSFMIQWHMIQLAIEHGCDRYNFYGISGNFNEDAQDYGVFTFKRSFNAVVAELVGDFTYIAKPTQYKIYNTLRNIKHSIQKG